MDDLKYQNETMAVSNKMTVMFIILSPKRHTSMVATSITALFLPMDDACNENTESTQNNPHRPGKQSYNESGKGFTLMETSKRH